MVVYKNLLKSSVRIWRQNFSWTTNIKLFKTAGCKFLKFVNSQDDQRSSTNRSKQQEIYEVCFKVEEKKRINYNFVTWESSMNFLQTHHNEFQWIRWKHLGKAQLTQLRTELRTKHQQAPITFHFMWKASLYSHRL